MVIKAALVCAILYVLFFLPIQIVAFFTHQDLFDRPRDKFVFWMIISIEILSCILSTLAILYF